jgi:hypothetical protein
VKAALLSEFDNRLARFPYRICFTISQNSYNLTTIQFRFFVFPFAAQKLKHNKLMLLYTRIFVRSGTWSLVKKENRLSVLVNREPGRVGVSGDWCIMREEIRNLCI